MVTLNDGRQFEGDILVGADGIWSEVIQMLDCMITNQFQQLTVIFSCVKQVHQKLFGAQEASYSSYTCYSGLGEYSPSYINSIGHIYLLKIDMLINRFWKRTKLTVFLGD